MLTKDEVGHEPRDCEAHHIPPQQRGLPHRIGLIREALRGHRPGLSDLVIAPIRTSDATNIAIAVVTRIQHVQSLVVLLVLVVLVQLSGLLRKSGLVEAHDDEEDGGHGPHGDAHAPLHGRTDGGDGVEAQRRDGSHDEADRANGTEDERQEGVGQVLLGGFPGDGRHQRKQPCI
jgi:hypothetical protein